MDSVEPYCIVRILLGILPEALRTKCARCSNYQREGGLKVITKLYYDYPEHYSRLRAKWDPTGEYHRRFEEYLRGLQFNVISNDNGNVFNEMYFPFPNFNAFLFECSTKWKRCAGVWLSTITSTTNINNANNTTGMPCVFVRDNLSLTPNAHFPNYHRTSIIRHISSFRLYSQTKCTISITHTHNLYTFFLCTSREGFFSQYRHTKTGKKPGQRTKLSRCNIFDCVSTRNF